MGELFPASTSSTASAAGLASMSSTASVASTLYTASMSSAAGLASTASATGGASATSLVRHPRDPEPVASTKSIAVMALGLAALVTGPLVAGVVPAVLALALARQARADLIAGQGYLTGAQRLRQGELFALIGLGLSAVGFVVAAVVAILTIAGGPIPYDFPDTMD